MLGLVAVATAVLLRWLLDPVMGDALPLVTLFGAVAAAVWLGGYRRRHPGCDPRLHCVSLFVYWTSRPIGYYYCWPCGRVHCISLHLCPHHRFRRSGAYRSLTVPRERQEVLRVTLRSIGDAVITTDNEGRITYLNEVAESLTGWSYEDALGQATRPPCFKSSTR